MDLEKAKEKLDSVGNGTALRHSKILISDLCFVVKFLLSEIETLKKFQSKTEKKHWSANFTPPSSRIEIIKKDKHQKTWDWEKDS